MNNFSTLMNLKVYFWLATVLLLFYFGKAKEANQDGRRGLGILPEGMPVIERNGQNRKRQTDDPIPDRLCIRLKFVYNSKWNNKSIELGYENGAQLIDVVVKETQRLFELSDELGTTINLVYDTPTFDSSLESDGWNANNYTRLQDDSIQQHVDKNETTIGYTNYYVFFTVDDQGSPENLSAVSNFGTMCYEDVPEDAGYKVGIVEFDINEVITGGWLTHSLGLGLGIFYDLEQELVIDHSTGGISFEIVGRTSSMGDECSSGDSIMDLGRNKTHWSTCSKEDLAYIYAFMRSGEYFCLHESEKCHGLPVECVDKYPECPDYAYVCEERSGPITVDKFVENYRFVDCPRTCRTCCTDRYPEKCAAAPCKCNAICTGQGMQYEDCLKNVRTLRNDECRGTCDAMGCKYEKYYYY